ncbi:MAG TPA: DnaB-like helicase N-terminal domain-containing protein [Blastocatellia bacterium]|nr:DnaB-like helicase N-terminal domain-containing protein [Blastocatellia bacterium]
MNSATSLIDDRELPSSVEAERAILGAILLDSPLVAQAVAMLRSEDFYLKAHRDVFEAILALASRNEPIDLITLINELRTASKLESVGGVTFLASLIDGVPKLDNLSYYAAILEKKTRARRLIRMANDILNRAYDEQDGLDDVLHYAVTTMAELSEEGNKSGSPLICSFADFIKEQYYANERIAFEALRRELVLLAAITNRGKSTLLRNALLSLSCGKEFLPLVRSGPARKVMLLDFETSRPRLQADLNKMTESWMQHEIELAKRNLFIVCEPVIGEDILSLSTHLSVIEHIALNHGVDLIAVDTASGAFDIYNENDNGEVGRRALKPLLRLARRLNCVVVLAHHIGKMGQEESRRAEKAYRARGASAWGCWPTSIFNITSGADNPERMTLSCAKRKDGPEYDVVMHLNQSTRWIGAVDTAVTRIPKTREIIRSVVKERMRKTEIIAALKEKGIPESTIEKWLKKDIEDGYLRSPRRGLYEPAQSAIRTVPYNNGGNDGNSDSKTPQ